MNVAHYLPSAPASKQCKCFPRTSPVPKLCCVSCLPCATISFAYTAVAAGGSYSVWGLKPLGGQQGSPLNGLAGLGGGAWGNAPMQAALPPAQCIGVHQSALPMPVGASLQHPSKLPMPTVPAVAAGHAQAVAAPAPSTGGASGLFVVRCKGLPFSATVDSVMDFFNPLVRQHLRHSTRSYVCSFPCIPFISRCGASCDQSDCFQSHHLVP